MRPITTQECDKNLLADIADDESYAAFEADFNGATVSNQCYHIVFSTDHQRGGIVFVGSGSTGATSWTDAKSADDVLARFLADNMLA